MTTDVQLCVYKLSTLSEDITANLMQQTPVGELLNHCCVISGKINHGQGKLRIVK